jgi:hypothetical protein
LHGGSAQTLIFTAFGEVGGQVQVVGQAFTGIGS